MATILKNSQDYGDYGVTFELTGMIVTQRNVRKTSQTREILGPNGDIKSFALFNTKAEVNLDGYISGTLQSTSIGALLGGVGSIFIDSINRAFSAEDVAKLTISATQYTGLNAA
jgi:hypothetical protein